MTPVMRGIAVAVAAVAVVACVKQAWRVTYPGPDNQSEGTDVLVESNGTAYMTGRIGNQTAFLAAYNASGKPLWNQVIPLEQYYHNRTGRTLEQDRDGNLYLLLWTSNFQGNLFKFDRQGNVLSSTLLENSEFMGHMKILDGVLYLSTPWSPELRAYNLEGELLWTYAPEIDDTRDSPLPDYTGAVTRAAGHVSSNGYLSLFGSDRLTSLAGQLYFRQRTDIVALDGQGSVIRSVSAAELGIDEIHSLVTSNNNLVLLGEAAGQWVTIALDNDFTELSRTQLPVSRTSTGLVAASSGVLCAGFDNQIAGGNREYHLYQLNALGEPMWSQTIEQDGVAWEFADVLPNQSGCYLTSQVLLEGNRLLVRTQHYDSTGTLTDTFALPDFGMFGTAVQGKSVYQVGITGEYDGSVTIATLDKKTRK